MKIQAILDHTRLAVLLLLGSTAAGVQADTGAGGTVSVASAAPVAQATVAGATAPHAPDPGAGAAADAASAGETPHNAAAADGPAAQFAPESLHGQWTVTEQHPEAGEVVTLFSVNSDATFAGTMRVAGEVVWTYSGSWSLEENQLTWIYRESTPPLMQVNEAEVDEIIAIDDEKLTYLSGTRGEVETLYRVID